MQAIFTENAPRPIGLYSQAIQTNGFIFLSGQIGIVPESQDLIDGGVVAELEQIGKNIQEILKHAGASSAQIVKTTVFLTDMRDFPFVNKTYGKYFPSHPARSTIEVSALPKSAHIEIECIAALI